MPKRSPKRRRSRRSNLRRRSNTRRRRTSRSPRRYRASVDVDTNDALFGVDTLVGAIFQQVTDNLKIVQDTRTKVTLRKVTTTRTGRRSFNVVDDRERTPSWPDDDAADNLYDVELEVDIEPDRCGMYSDVAASNASIGSKWRKIGPTAPESGRDLTKEKGLVTALNTKKEFT